MEPLPQNVRLVRQTYWFIRLRWLAIAGAVAAVFLATNFFNISLPKLKLYIVCAALFIYNLGVFLLLTYFNKRN